ncbi:MAG: BRO family protein [Caenibius sp.]
MSALIPLHFDTADVRMVMLDGVPWWVLADVAVALGLSNPTKLASRLDDYQKADLTIREGSSGQRRRMNIVNEAGVYALTLNSRKPEAKAFARWLFTKVLPSIRKFGMYPPPMADTALEGGAQDAGSPQARFMAECQRIADENGVTVDKLLEHIISPQQRRAIEMGHGPMENLLHRGKRWVAFTGMGMDLQYVLTGIWRTTPHERRVIQQLRQDSANQRLLTDGPA